MRTRASSGEAARRFCRRAALLLSLLASLSGCETLFYLAVPERDPNVKTADYSHFHDTVLDKAIDWGWGMRFRTGDCADGHPAYVAQALRRQYGRESPDRVATDLRKQGAVCVQTDEREFMCIYRQIVYCRTRSWQLGNADHRSDIEIQIQVRDHPDEYKRFVVETQTEITRLDAPR